jgi:YVTN family beta-propeller protein
VGEDALFVTTYGTTIDRQATWRLTPDTGSLSHVADTGVWPAGEGSAWFKDYSELDTLAEVDLDTHRVLATVHVPRSTSGVVWWADREAVWIVYQEATSLLKRLEPATGAVLATIPVGPVETILVDSGEVWVATNDGTVSRIDPATNQVVDTIEASRSPEQLALGGGSLWVSDARDPVVTRVDPETGELVTIRVGGTPLSMAYGEGGLWVLVRPT